MPVGLFELVAQSIICGISKRILPVIEVTTTKMEYFAKILNDFQPLTILGKRSILDVWQGSEYNSDSSPVIASFYKTKL